MGEFGLDVVEDKLLAEAINYLLSSVRQQQKRLYEAAVRRAEREYDSTNYRLLRKVRKAIGLSVLSKEEYVSESTKELREALGIR